jgi:acetylornithine deacetylase
VLFRDLAKHKVQTKTQVVCVLIASEENSEIEGVGVETLMESGKIDFIKNGPVFWVDCSDSQPCIGTAGAITWTLKATGKLFHSGLPNLGINGLELAMDAMTKIQEFFYQEFGPVAKEKEYNYSCPSTMKPTRIESSVNGLNQMYVDGACCRCWGCLRRVNACCSPVRHGPRSPETCVCLPSTT